MIRSYHLPNSTLLIVVTIVAAGVLALMLLGPRIRGGPGPFRAEEIAVRALALALEEYHASYGDIPVNKAEEFNALNPLRDAWTTNNKMLLDKARSGREGVAGSVSFEDLGAFGRYLNQPLLEGRRSGAKLVYVWNSPVQNEAYSHSIVRIIGVDLNLKFRDVYVTIGLDGIYVPAEDRAPDPPQHGG